MSPCRLSEAPAVRSLIVVKSGHNAIYPKCTFHFRHLDGAVIAPHSPSSADWLSYSQFGNLPCAGSLGTEDTTDRRAAGLKNVLI